jgi:dipeptidyl-peptidase-4
MGIQAIDPQSRWIYFTASPANVHSVICTAPPWTTRAAVRLSPAGQPGTNSYDISPNCQWAFHTYSRFDNPPVIDLIRLPEHKSVRVLEDNAVLRAAAASSLDAPAEFLQLKLDDGVTVDGWIIKPRVFDPSRKYPLLLFVYGEPAGVTGTSRRPAFRVA